MRVTLSINTGTTRYANLFLRVLLFTISQGILREDELDKKIEHWQKHYPPTRRTRFVDACTAVFNRQPYTDEELATVHQPVFILHVNLYPYFIQLDF
jgi:hypothetical protein